MEASCCRKLANQLISSLEITYEMRMSVSFVRMLILYPRRTEMETYIAEDRILARCNHRINGTDYYPSTFARPQSERWRNHFRSGYSRLTHINCVPVFLLADHYISHLWSLLGMD
jgi:hypothetical protein